MLAEHTLPVQQQSLKALVVEEGAEVAFHCAIHGTVTKCPLVYMSCEASDTPDLTTIRHLPKEVLEQWRERQDKYEEHD